MKIPAGAFGSVPLSSEQPDVFENEWDPSHLFFEDNYDSRLKGKFSYSSHFSFDYQVAAYANLIPLRCCLKGTPEEKKCLFILYSYLDEALQVSGIVEYFTSLNGKEEQAITTKRHIRWLDVKDPYDLVLEDLEFWQITY